MLKTNFLAAFGIVVTIASVVNPANAQSNRGYTLSGDSLTGINQRTANEDFSIFFINQSSNRTPVNNLQQNTFPNTGYSQVEQQVQIGNTPVLLQPGQQTLTGNDGLQLQFDLTNIDKSKEFK